MAQNIPREFIDQLLAKTDLVDLINTFVPLQKKSSHNYFARCPFHTEKSASFSVSQPKQFYYCFGCGAHGNAVDFMMQFERLSFVEAIEALARQAGMPLPETSQHSKEKQQDFPALYELMQKVTQTYYDSMCTSERAISYLKSRGISGQMAKQFQLGYVPQAWGFLSESLGKSSHDQTRLLQMGLLIRKEDGHCYDRFRDRILFPIHDYRGRIIGFGGRVIDQGEPKYLNSPETPLFQKGHELYGLYHVLQANRHVKRVVIVEGYMDVISLHQHGIQYAVATLGTATTSHHLQRLFRYTSELIFCFDGDAAGKKAAWRALEVIFPLLFDGLTVRFLFLPDQEDPDSWIKQQGRDVFEKQCDEAMPLSHFFFQTLLERHHVTLLEGRAALVAEALPYLRQLHSEVLQQVFIEALSKRIRMEVTDLKRLLQGGEPITTTQPKSVAPTQKAQTPFVGSQALRVALGLLIQYPSQIEVGAVTLPEGKSEALQLLQQLCDWVRNRPDVTTANLIEWSRGMPEANWVSELAAWEHVVPDAGIQAEWAGALRQVALQQLDELIQALLLKAGQGVLSEEDRQTLSRYIAEKKGLAEAV